MWRRTLKLAVLALALTATACGDEQVAEAPPPAELTREAIGYYCNMIVQDHQGPKGQIFLSDSAEPIWFSSVRDTLAFTRLPEEPKNVAAIYVNDMGRASWNSPEAGTWIAAEQAWYVIGSERRGGMGAPEAVPFAQRADAEAFAARHRGHVAAFTEIPQEALLGDVEAPHSPGHGQPGSAMSEMSEDSGHHHGQEVEDTQ